MGDEEEHNQNQTDDQKEEAQNDEPVKQDDDTADVNTDNTADMKGDDNSPAPESNSPAVEREGGSPDNVEKREGSPTTAPQSDSDSD